jgi:ribosomal protein S18 acetylase RimI-like enzyme
MNLELRENIYYLNKFKELGDLNLITENGGYLIWRHATSGGAEVCDIFVDSGLRGKGIGTKMMKGLEETKPKFIMLFTKEHNINAQAFYLACGFEEVGRICDNILYKKTFNEENTPRE